jgi:hypothetical protein
MEDKKLIAQALLDIAKRSETTFLEVGKEDKELIEAAKKIGIELPSPDLMVMKTVYAEIDKVNLNGVILPRKAVKEGLNTLIGKQCNWEHNGSGYVCGYTISAQINEDKVETINVLFKSLFPEQAEELKEKVKSGDAAVSFEIWNIDPETKKSVVKELENGFKEIYKIIFHGTGVLLAHKPACPKAKIFKLAAKKELEDAEKIVDKVFNEGLVYAQMAIEEPKCVNCGSCNCTKDKEENKLELKELYANVTKEEEITFDLAMAFYYASDEEKANLTEDAAKWTRKFINNLPDSAFAAIEPAYPEKTEDKNARHLPHHNGEGDLGKEKSNANLDLPHYKNALARVNQINPISDSISVDDLRAKASAHLERHKDALEKSEVTTEEITQEAKEKLCPECKQPLKDDEKDICAVCLKKKETNKSTEEPKTEVIAEETKTQETVVDETKPVETKVEETKEVAQPLEVIEPKIVVKTTSIYSEVRIDTYVDGTPSGTEEVKGYTKTITEYKDGTKDEVETEVEIKKKYDLAEVEEKVNAAKAEKDAEITALKLEHDAVIKAKDEEIKNKTEELGTKDQEIADLKNPKVEPKKEKILTVGSVDIEKNSEIKKQAQNINNIIASKHNQ